MFGGPLNLAFAICLIDFSFWCGTKNLRRKPATQTEQRSASTRDPRRRKPVTDYEKWTAQRSKEDKWLYEEYGKPLEQEHTGEYVAIGPDGLIIFGESTDEVLQKGVEAFGGGNFALFRIGYPALEKWLSLTR